YGFTDDASRIAYDADGNAHSYCLRSPYDSDDYYARCVDHDGYVYNGYVINCYGVRPALTRKLD
ncbi:MAG: DUF6273 domain-containing protein, partial [Candidatus Enterosoma sp.]|nr:DUF6273 domain-containing protein [Mollicutes bacterium]MDY5851407.1 DUF6273 domain-containing protein [Candidatus Enterosoma sp.]